ncbi:hypothetical protein ASZ90_009892 [hydrocarbon metagenome]|uniref:Uncharacterized protein n=1 Tax=hydrocarbon metagenome TaxID=938273 RepID=A0A0W8FHJ0_9ZZZZ
MYMGGRPAIAGAAAGKGLNAGILPGIGSGGEGRMSRESAGRSPSCPSSAVA